ncbi:MAG: Lrp/AsnC family transcriptional regulator [Nostocoides sp.]
MEDIDRKIVQHLIADGRMSYTDLGRAMGLSTSAVHQRVRRLEERGIITGYTATVNYAEVGLPLTAFMSVTALDPGAPDDVPDRLRGMPQIEGCYSVAGEEGYILQVRVGTPGELEELIAQVRAAANVATRTTVVLSTPWER